LFSRYPGSFYIARTLAVSGETNTNINELRTIIQDLTFNQRQMGEEIPVRVRREGGEREEEGRKISREGDDSHRNRIPSFYWKKCWKNSK
jgi:hypothetical protein